MTSPRDFGVPHDDWRPHQEVTIGKLLLPNSAPVQMLTAPTGSGKSAIATAIGSRHRVIALMETKELQRQYEKYGFRTLMGRGNYRCVSEEFPNIKTCDLCPYLPIMKNCPFHNVCLYAEQKRKALASNLMTLNYSLFFGMRSSLPGHSYYVADEADLLSGLVIAHSGTTISESDVRRYNLAPIPSLRTTEGVLSYLVKVSVDYKAIHDPLSLKENKNPAELHLFRKVVHKLRDINATIAAMHGSMESWYFEDDGEKLIVKPLTARFHAPFIFQWSTRKTLLMSATLGNTKLLAEELGIPFFGDTVIPHQYYKRTRPIYDLRCPKIGYNTKPAAYRVWADKITEFIKLAPPHWGGLILVNSKAQAAMLRDLLSVDDKLRRRLFVANPTVGTNDQMREWRAFKRRQIGAINISWSLWQGVSFDDEKILVVAKTPFPQLSSYEKARRDYNKAFFYQRVAQKLAQGLGRTRRSASDYDTDGNRNSLVGVADGNWYIVKRFLPQYIRESVLRL